MSYKLGKRGLSVIKGDIKNKELYEAYLDFMGPSLSSNFGEPNRTIVPNKLFRQILKDYFQEWIRLILYEGERYKLPFGLGEIRIRKKKMNIANLVKYDKLQMDYGIFQKTGKKVFFLNEHRGRFKYNIFWQKKGFLPKVKGMFPYQFKPVRYWKRELAHILKYEPQIDYLT